MKIIIHQGVKCSSHYCGTFRKEYDSNAIPVKGMYIEDSAWKQQEKKITQVSLNLKDEYYYVTVEDESTNEKAYPELQKMYEGHGWECLGASTTSHPKKKSTD